MRFDKVMSVLQCTRRFKIFKVFAAVCLLTYHNLLRRDLTHCAGRAPPTQLGESPLSSAAGLPGLGLSRNGGATGGSIFQWLSHPLSSCQNSILSQSLSGDFPVMSNHSTCQFEHKFSRKILALLHLIDCRCGICIAGHPPSLLAKAGNGL